MNSKYIPNTTGTILGHLVEECGEVMAAIGKTFRYGLECYNPEVPAYERETNRNWILRELDDLESALIRARSNLRDGHPDRSKGSSE